MSVQLARVPESDSQTVLGETGSSANPAVLRSSTPPEGSDSASETVLGESSANPAVPSSSASPEGSETLLGANPSSSSSGESAQASVPPQMPDSLLEIAIKKSRALTGEEKYSLLTSKNLDNLGDCSSGTEFGT